MIFLLSFLAGLLTTLSPCVLPVLPFVTASSLKKGRSGPLLLALGVLVSFVGVSLVISRSGMLFGLDPGMIRQAAGTILFLSGCLFFSPRLSSWFATQLSGLTNSANRCSNVELNASPLGEFLNGILLGIVWTPCSGPSLGAALGLAAESGTFFLAALRLGFFGLGAVIPLLAFAYGTRGFTGWIRRESSHLNIFKQVFGTLMMIFGILIAFGGDKYLESRLTDLMPQAWLEFITQF